jgi:lysophospholipid acyltransferase (LPLAT)-like uncharacterized protein
MNKPVDGRPRPRPARAPGEARRRPAGKPRPQQVKALRKRPPRAPSIGTRLLRAPIVQKTAASAIAGYLRLVNRTSPLSFDPPDPYGKYLHLQPVIFTMWHGQHFMLPFAKIFEFDVRVLISRHHDGEINALVAEKLGVGTIRGSTARKAKHVLHKGGMVGFLEMKAALEEGACVSMTADISNLAPRRAGLGIVSLARVSGRPIVPLAYATSRRIDVESWDQATINLPFSRAVCAVAEPLTVPADADDALMEAKRREVEEALNEATHRARRLVGKR